MELPPHSPGARFRFNPSSPSSSSHLRWSSRVHPELPNSRRFSGSSSPSVRCFICFAEPMTDRRISVILYILFAVLFLVMSHLQERLQRRPELETTCSLRHHALQPWDIVSLSCESDSKDLEGHIPVQSDRCTPYPPITIQLIRYDNADDSPVHGQQPPIENPTAP